MKSTVFVYGPAGSGKTKRAKRLQKHFGLKFVLVHYLLAAGAELRSLGDIRWHATEDGQPGKGIGRFTMAFVLRGKK